MRYFSTRDKNNIVSSKEAVIKGISEEGGLFVPETFPSLPSLEELIDLSYKEVAYKILSLYFTDYTEEELWKAVNGAYDEKFRKESVIEIKSTKKAHFLELFHGPTLAFKDMALTILPYLLKAAVRTRNIDKKIVILTATSGDTGKAALEGFKDIEGINVIVFYPDGGVSPIQRLQMVTQRGNNTFVSAIKGNFDDAQSGVKEVFSDVDFNGFLEKQGYILSSANSINIGRLIPQITYYVYGYIELLRRKVISKGEKINIVVPTGNFGNILAAYYGKRMGLPVNRLICASNNNKVLADFFNTGIYDKERDLILTSSPSMDILVSSNLERFLFHISGNDENITREKMTELRERGKYYWDDFKENIYGNFTDEGETSYWIKRVYEGEDYIIDPHTAVAYGVYMKYLEEEKDETKTLIASTASPFKFHKKVLTSIGKGITGKDFRDLEGLAKVSNTKVPKHLAELEVLPEIHNTLCQKDEMRDVILKFLKVNKND
ncbi:MAG: threonine synthase [Tissierellia bacterium]|nr:threonine synthase [Tissierellia bacterium]